MSLPMYLPMCSPGGALLLPMCSPPVSLPMCSHPFLHLMFSPNRITACAVIGGGLLPPAGHHWMRAVASSRAHLSLFGGACLPTSLNRFSLSLNLLVRGMCLGSGSVCVPASLISSMEGPGIKQQNLEGIIFKKQNLERSQYAFDVSPHSH